MLSALALSLLAAPQDSPPPGFTPLFDGRTFAGWRGRPHLAPGSEETWTEEERERRRNEWEADLLAHWRIEDGEIVNDGQGVFLTTDRDWGDFELLLEYRTVPLADSGIYLRGCPQVQIWDTTEAGGKWELGADKGSGGLWNNQRFPRDPLVHADRPFGEWNRLRILMVGARVSVWLNGLLTVDHTPLENYWDRTRPIPARGPIQLQTHGGEIRFRNLYLREIQPEEANLILAAAGDEGFRRIFNGRDLRGWAGPVADYVVVGGALQCRPGRGGTIYTEEEFGDFAVRLQFLLPPGGNNGLAIRYPGSGDTAYVGMCEVQVLDDSAPRYAGLKPWQYHGSIYGMVPAARGYLRPPGVWNFEEVTVVGSRIRVELNGTIITEADLAEIEQPMSGHEHPGRTRTRGHFGFAGHNNPVRFREVFVRRLD
ncbi:MAG: DUF1080 domain-containing protein [Planctomycetota bacterium]|nr:MAG: DUF1080 domain-containing protein [Planctomycetota bacterium]